MMKKKKSENYPPYPPRRVEKYASRSSARVPEWQHARAAKRQSDRKQEQSRAKTADHRVGVADDRREPITRTTNGRKAASTVVNGHHAITCRRAPESSGEQRRAPHATNAQAHIQKRKNKQTNTPTNKRQASERVERRKARRRDLPPGWPSAESAEHRIRRAPQRAGAGTC